ncbi:AAA family ATPase [Thiomicrorhabdus aquaedulcis]|uniref:AAA family ATPase n=1 Tax=Thiomicrorhabdus aquaedulcis TaxID=2211106 RepID=UPI000FD8B076|nr:AAA family ATPase [Thiomicrorhabdus aquaedulcis]
MSLNQVDIFLPSREKAQSSWEVTQVNELLIQMESYEGVFIASNNLMDNINSTAMLRFDLKIEFKSLRFEPAGLLLQQLVK